MKMSKLVNGVLVDMTPQDIVQAQESAAAAEAAKPAQYSAQIDADTDAIYRDAVGSRAPEYEAAERDAIAFINSQDNSAPPESVRSYADAAGLSYTEAADKVLEQASAWRQAMQVIRANRLAAKIGVRGESPDPAMKQWTEFVTGIRQQLGI